IGVVVDQMTDGVRIRESPCRLHRSCRGTPLVHVIHVRLDLVGSREREFWNTIAVQIPHERNTYVRGQIGDRVDALRRAREERAVPVALRKRDVELPVTVYVAERYAVRDSLRQVARQGIRDREAASAVVDEEKVRRGIPGSDDVDVSIAVDIAH